MNISIRFLVDALLRSLRLVGLQACEQALAQQRDQPVAAPKPQPKHMPSGEHPDEPS